MHALYLLIVIIALIVWLVISFVMIPGSSAIWFYVKKFLIKCKRFDDDIESEIGRIEKDESDRW